MLSRMKRSLLLVVLLACFRGDAAAQTMDVPGTSLQLELRPTASEQYLPALGESIETRIRLFGPPTERRVIFRDVARPTFRAFNSVVRSGTGTLSVRPQPQSIKRLDAPGPGYREQRARLYGP